jgi:hypothetical protein
MYVGDITGFATNMGTTISGMPVNIYVVEFYYQFSFDAFMKSSILAILRDITH